MEGLESNRERLEKIADEMLHKVKLEMVADKMLEVAVNNKISCSEIEMVMYYLKKKIKRIAGDKEL